jgi:peroxiredoxin
VRVNLRTVLCVLTISAVTECVWADEKSPETSKPAGKSTELGEKAPDFEVPIVTFENAVPIVSRTSLFDFAKDQHILLYFVSNFAVSGFESWAHRIMDDKAVYLKHHILPVFVIAGNEEHAIALKKSLRFPFLIAPDPDGTIVKQYGLPPNVTLDDWIQLKSPSTQICLIDNSRVLRYWCTPFVINQDYEYMAYRALLLGRPPDDPAVKRVEEFDRKKLASPVQKKSQDVGGKQK